MGVPVMGHGVRSHLLPFLHSWGGGGVIPSADVFLLSVGHISCCEGGEGINYNRPNFLRRLRGPRNPLCIRNILRLHFPIGFTNLGGSGSGDYSPFWKLPTTELAHDCHGIEFVTGWEF